MTLWLIWRAKNKYIFKTKIPKVGEVVQSIKRLSWERLLGCKSGLLVFIMNGFVFHSSAWLGSLFAFNFLSNSSFIHVRKSESSLYFILWCRFRTPCDCIAFYSIKFLFATKNN